MINLWSSWESLSKLGVGLVVVACLLGQQGDSVLWMV